MSEDYDYACQRAELLGLPVPSREEWQETRAVDQDEKLDDEGAFDEAAQNLDHEDETAQRITGGLDELQSILNATQKKLNRFKTVCGSLGTLLKVRVGSRDGTPNHKCNNETDTEAKLNEEKTTDESMTIELKDDEPREQSRTDSGGNAIKKINMSEKMSSHLDKLDSLIMKTETAQMSMQHQTKQMKSFLK